MNRILLFVLLILLTGSLLKGQISLEHSYTTNQLTYTNLKYSGEKYYLLDAENFKIKIYNLDHSLFKSLDIPVAYDGFTPTSIYHLSEGLFTNDNKLSFLTIFSNTSNGSMQYKARISDENNTILAEIDDCSYGLPIQTKEEGAKLICYINNANYSQSSKVYSLPGSVEMKIENFKNNTAKEITLSKAYPNPSNGITVINYKLPNNEYSGIMEIYNIKGQLVRKYNVDKTFSSLHVSSAGLTSGVYNYILKTQTSISQAKQFVITK